MSRSASSTASVGRVEVHLDAAAVAARAHLDRAAERDGERVLGRRERVGEVGVHEQLAAPAARARRPPAPSPAARSPAPTSRCRGRRWPRRLRSSWSFAIRIGAAVALGQGSRPRSARAPRRAARAGGRGSTPRPCCGRPAADLALGQPQVVDEHRAGARLLDRVEVDARHVLGQREVESLPVVGLPHHRRDPLEPGELRRPQAALAGDQLERAARAAGARRPAGAARASGSTRPAPAARPRRSRAAAGAGWARRARAAAPAGRSRRRASGAGSRRGRGPCRAARSLGSCWASQARLATSFASFR